MDRSIVSDKETFLFCSLQQPYNMLSPNRIRFAYGNFSYPQQGDMTPVAFRSSVLLHKVGLRKLHYRRSFIHYALTTVCPWPQCFHA